MDTKKLVSEIIKIDGVDSNAIFDLLSIPPKQEMGDFALPCFSFAKIQKCAPNMVAEKIAKTLENDKLIDHTEIVNGYLNIYLNKQIVLSQIVDELYEKKSLSTNTTGKGKKMCIDFSSVNIAKEPHIGHFFSTVVGASVARLFEASGYKVVRMNYLGDYGSQFAKLVYGFMVWSSEEEIKKGGVGALQQIYIKANEVCKTDPKFLEECRNTFKKMEEKDPEILRIYEWFKKISIEESQNVLFKPLGLKFDDWRGEGFYSQFTDEALAELEQKGLSKPSQGATIVDLEPYGLGVALVRQSNGTTLYCTRDIAAALHRHKEYNFDVCVWVTGQEQALYFKQLFKILELMGYEWSKGLIHITNGRVRTPEGRLSSRLGNVALAKDIISDAIKKASEIIEARTGKKADKNLAKDIGLGALTFSLLKADVSKDSVFVLEDALNFDGETAPYVMYTHARCASILSKAKIDGDCDYSAILESSWELVKLLNNFNASVLLAQQKNDPSIVTKYAISLATVFNKFYHDTKIICDDKKKMNAGLKIVEITKRVLKEALALLGINAPDKM